MNFEYLKKVLKTRELEILEGKNAMTTDPIYVVLSMQEHICSGHSDYSLDTNYKDRVNVFGYVDTALDPEDMEVYADDCGMESPEAVTLFWTDVIEAFFLTHEAAKDYMRYQRHNLSEPYIYVFNFGYRNYQMLKLFHPESRDDESLIKKCNNFFRYIKNKIIK